MVSGHPYTENGAAIMVAVKLNKRSGCDVSLRVVKIPGYWRSSQACSETLNLAWNCISGRRFWRGEVGMFLKTVNL